VFRAIGRALQRPAAQGRRAESSLAQRHSRRQTDDSFRDVHHP
jgi:hypothetical protein